MSSTHKTSSVEALVIKRSSVGETDRVVTLLTREQGKIVTIAKGVRKITSSKRAYLEPGNHVRCQLVMTKSMPLLTQATLITDCAAIHTTLPKIRQLTQLLEIIDALFVETHEEEHLFDLVLKIRKEIIKPGATSGSVKQYFDELIVELGYQHPRETSYDSLLEYVSALADRPMRSWEYLKT